MSGRPTSRRNRSQAPTTLSVYYGAEYIGDLEDYGDGRAVAYATGKGGGIKVCTFENRIDVMRAVSRGHP
jgi:hypothetical protein